MANKVQNATSNLNCDDTCVENTNSESLLSKLSVIESGYRVDPFLRIFRTNDRGEVKRATRSSAINRGYLARLMALECSLEKYLLIYSSIGITHQVLSLGSGYDSLYFRLRNQGIIKPEYCSYYEVDFPIVPHTKWRFIYNNNILKSFFKLSTSYYNDECFSLDQGVFNMIGCNMTDTTTLERRLESVGFNWKLPTIVFCECSLTYVEVSQSISITWWLTSKIPHMIFIDYEQIQPFDSFGQIMTSHFQKRNSALKCVEYYPSIYDHLRRFKSLGWKTCNILDIETVFKENCGIDELRRRQKFNEQFDEPEEFKSKCLHYILCIGSNSNLLTSISLTLTNKSNLKLKSIPPARNYRYIRAYENKPYTVDSDIYVRWGHCSWNTPENDVVILGGYSQKTFRDCTLSILGRKDDTFYLKKKSFFPANATLFAAAAQLENFDVFVFGGRSSPEKSSNTLYALDSYGISIKEIRSQNNQPEARWKHTLNPLPYKRLLLVGGKNKAKTFADVHIYDIKSCMWKLVLKLPHSSYSHSTCSLISSGEGLQKVVVTGGLNEYESINERVYVISINKENKVIYNIWLSFNLWLSKRISR